MDRQENLRPPWPKGVSGNPKGKAKGRTVRSALRLHLEESDPKKPEQERRQSAAEKLWDESEKDASFMLDMLKWLEGSSPKESEPDHTEDEPDLTPEDIEAFEDGKGASEVEPGGIRLGGEQETVAPGETPEAPEPEAT